MPMTSFQSAGLRFSKYSPVEGDPITGNEILEFRRCHGFYGSGQKKGAGVLS